MVRQKGRKSSNRAISFAFALVIAGISLTATGWLFADEEANSDQNGADNEISAAYKEKWERLNDSNPIHPIFNIEVLPDSTEERMLLFSPGDTKVQMPDICERPDAPDWCFDKL